jgi:A/G-specific adenine glycosylase
MPSMILPTGADVCDVVHSSEAYLSAMLADRTFFVRELLAWGRRNRRSFPWRTERDPFRILIAEVLLQRSRGTSVAPVYERLFERWPTAAELARARVDSIRSVIRPLELIRRAETLKAIARVVTNRGSVPRLLDGLLELPGVGQYAASATAAVAFNTRIATVDGVTARVYRRYFGIESQQPASIDRDLWALVGDVTPERGVRDWNWAVLDLAATVCLPQIPRCAECPLDSRCRWASGRSIARVSASR